MSLCVCSHASMCACNCACGRACACVRPWCVCMCASVCVRVRIYVREGGARTGRTVRCQNTCTVPAARPCIHCACVHCACTHCACTQTLRAQSLLPDPACTPLLLLLGSPGRQHLRCCFPAVVQWVHRLPSGWLPLDACVRLHDAVRPAPARPLPGPALTLAG